MKIVHTESSDGWGGQEIRILQESLELKKQGHKVSILGKGGGRLEEECARSDVEFLPLAMRGALDPPSILNAYKYFRGWKPDIVHCHSSKDHWICSVPAKLLGIPVVRSRHISVPLNNRASTRYLYRVLSDRVIASGQVVSSLVMEATGCDEDHVVSVPAGVDLERFDPHRIVDPSRLRKEMKIPKDGKVVGCVGVLRSWKGHHVLLEAAVHLKGEYPGMKVLLVGDGPMRLRLEKLVEKMDLNDTVIMTGHRQDIPEIMAVLDVFVLPSTRAEATSQVIPQAWAMGRAVVASRVGGIPEIVEDGVDGFLVPPEDPVSLAESISRLLREQHLSSSFGAAGKRKAHNIYSFDHQIESTFSVYRQLVEG